MAVYKIYHKYSCDVEADAVYVESDLPQTRLADLVIGLQFFVEDNTRCGRSSCITEGMASYLLCNFFDCKPSGKAEWLRLVKGVISKKVTGAGRDRGATDVERVKDDVMPKYCIELVGEREQRAGPHYKRYKVPIRKLNNTKYIRALRAFFDAEDCFKTAPAVTELLSEFGQHSSLRT